MTSPGINEADVAHDLHHNMRIDIDFTPGQVIDGMDVDRALRLADLPPLQHGCAVFTAYVTTPEVGKDVSQDPFQESDIIPMFDHERIWVISGPEYTSYGGGGLISDPTPAPSLPYPAHIVMLLGTAGHWLGVEVSDGPIGTTVRPSAQLGRPWPKAHVFRWPRPHQ